MLFVGKHKKGNNYIGTSNDVSDVENPENSSKRKGKHFKHILVNKPIIFKMILELMVGEQNGDNYEFSSTSSKTSICLFVFKVLAFSIIVLN
jgi:hypothetical protein